MLYRRVESGDSLEPYDGHRPFRAIVVVEEPVSTEWRNLASNWLINADCLYMMAWGHECSLWDDSVDWANLERFNFDEVPARNFVMTTWHAEESLQDVFWFAKNLACAADSSVNITETLILHVSRVDRR